MRHNVLGFDECWLCLSVLGRATVFLVHTKCTKALVYRTIPANEKAPDGLLLSAPVYDNVPHAPAVFFPS